MLPEKRLKVPVAAPWSATGVLMVCCWWSGAALLMPGTRAVRSAPPRPLGPVGTELHRARGHAR
eukprot:4782983-Alexandrium_andersonii.AAC.1